MRRVFALASVLVVMLSWTGVAHGGIATLTVTDVPVHADRTLQSVARPGEFDFVGLHWRGHGRVQYRVKTLGARWSRWTIAEQSDGPDRGSSEARAARGWTDGEGVWVGRRVALQVRASRGISRVRAFTVRSPVSRVPLRNLSAASAPPVVPRSGWQADESIRRAEPQFADTMQFAIVHHTAGDNEYTREQAPAVVRAIELYHVKGNGWNDIGYNALVDRYGTVYEGRYGGIDRNVVGAHAKGFNTGSFGIAVLGEFTKTAPPAAARDALVRTLAWRLDLAHVDPLTTFNAISAGNERFPAGIPVFMRGISGHRDTGATTCPGQKLYDLLPTIAKSAATTGLPKLFQPVVTGTLGGLVELSARLSDAVAWRAAITDASGATVFETAGTGPDLAATWDATGVDPGEYRWTIDGPGLTPASGTIGSGGTSAPLSFTGASVDPETIAPDGDGILDITTLTYDLSANANVTVRVLEAATGLELAVLDGPRWRRAGEHVLTFNGIGLPDGLYELRLGAAASGGRTAETTIGVSISRTVGKPSLQSAYFTPNGDGRSDRLRLRYTLAKPASVKLTILRGSTWTATPFTGEVAAGQQTIEWDGSKSAGRLREGAYLAELAVTDAIATARVVLPFVVDFTPPRVRILGLAPLRVRVSEPARLRIVTERGSRSVVVTAPGIRAFPAIRRPRRVEIVAVDAAGNRAAPVRSPAH
ncbi:MAG: N-acetylmuramoyl-L-alanine amidase [Gaiellales bacterium]